MVSHVTMWPRPFQNSIWARAASMRQFWDGRRRLRIDRQLLTAISSHCRGFRFTVPIHLRNALLRVDCFSHGSRSSDNPVSG
ncbi:hypothetical protein E6O75_ATG09998 [Venturia nashicola]|uniref:Uncharacterized protein n=1 Tax=Venturia nashicola TaxID=86259 RepID=A0A4Z1NQN9_9PEZI|nr:hypothetical protein E6O75_ATG09998 [Venturia nashicola]